MPSPKRGEALRGQTGWNMPFRPIDPSGRRFRMDASRIAGWRVRFSIQHSQPIRKFKRALDGSHRDSAGNYRLSALGADDVILHAYGDYDEAITSATSQIIEALTRLFLATDDSALYEENEKLIEQALGRALAQQYGQIGILNACRFAGEPLSLVIAATDRTDELVSIANRTPDPRRLDKFVLVERGKTMSLPTGGTIELEHPAAWFCKGHVCLPPVDTGEALRSLL